MKSYISHPLYTRIEPFIGKDLIKVIPGQCRIGKDNYPKYVITMDEMQSGGNYQGIKQISLRDFLLAEDKEKQ